MNTIGKNAVDDKETSATLIPRFSELRLTVHSIEVGTESAPPHICLTLTRNT